MAPTRARTYDRRMTESSSSPREALPAPLSPEAPLPHRKTLRQWLIPLSGRSTARALALLAFDYALLIALMALAVALQAVWAKALAGLAAGFVIGRLFIIGHDACHQSLTPHRGLNRWLGRIAFLPSLTPYSLWDAGHNVVHHGFTNLKGVDFVWAPLTPDEFAALPARQRLLQRIYRSGWAPGLYYMVEIWWHKMLFPSRRAMPSRRAIFIWDGLLVSAFGLLWAGALVAAARATQQPVLPLLLTALALPFLFWCAMIGFVVYVHHTHTRVHWHADKASWQRAQPFVSTTVHLTFGFHAGALMHHIMEHTAHHVDMSIPLYRLKNAQKLLEQMLPGRIVIQRFSWRWYFDTARRCKLYDFTRRCWTDFKGRPTSQASPLVPASA